MLQLLKHDDPCFDAHVSLGSAYVSKQRDLHKKWVRKVSENTFTIISLNFSLSHQMYTRSPFFRLKIFINLIAFGPTRAWWRGALNLECHSSTVSFSNTPWTWIRCWRCAVIERKSVDYGWIDNALKEVAKTTISDLQMRFAFRLSPLSSTSLYVLTNLICHWSLEIYACTFELFSFSNMQLCITLISNFPV